MPTQKTITQTCYTFSELLAETEEGNVTSSSLDRARYKLQEMNTHYGWWESTFEYWEYELEQKGFPNAKIMFTGFWSQGDGACFESEMDLPTVLKHMIEEGYQVNPHLLRLANDAWVYSDGKLKNVVRYVHEGSIIMPSIHQDYNRYAPKIEKACLELEEQVNDYREALCRTIYSALESEYEYLCSDEQLADFAAANDITFDESGNIW